MTKYLVLLFILLASKNLNAQTDGPIQITKAIEERIARQVNELANSYIKSLESDNYLEKELQFIRDTFVINHTMQAKYNIDYSTNGFNLAVSEAIEAYDKILNNIYNEVLKRMEPADKKILIASQKNWLAFRDSESKLIDKLGEEKYFGGGTARSNVQVENNLNILVHRVCELYDRSQMFAP